MNPNISPETQQAINELMEEAGLTPAQPVQETRPNNFYRRKNWMRNRSCLCGSKKKFKNCCWGVFK